MIKDILHHLAERGDLSAPQLHDFTCAILDGLCSPAQTGAFLMALAQRPITSDYIVAAVTAIRARAIKLTLFPEAIDCCGTGGDHSQSLNISTATGFVAAACGVKIAKHGNRAATSRSGAADVLEALGVNLDLSLFQEEQALDHIGFSFLMAPNHHPALKNLAPIRRELGFRTLLICWGRWLTLRGRSGNSLAYMTALYVTPLRRPCVTSEALLRLSFTGQMVLMKSRCAARPTIQCYRTAQLPRVYGALPILVLT